jgi:uncharacterized protein YacL
MITDEERKFIAHWETVRVEYSTLQSKMLRGLPAAILFTLPILFSIVGVQLLSPDWFTKLSQKAMSSTLPIIISIIVIIFFFSIARMHFKWEMNEQLFKEIKNKLKQEQA